VTAVDMVGNTITKVFHVVRVDATSVTPKLQGVPDVHPAAPGYKNDGQAGVQLVPAASQVGRPQSGAEQGQSPATTTAVALPETGATHSPLASIVLSILSVLGLAGLASRKRRV